MLEGDSVLGITSLNTARSVYIHVPTGRWKPVTIERKELIKQTVKLLHPGAYLIKSTLVQMY